MSQRVHIITFHSYLSVAKELLQYQGYVDLFITEIIDEKQIYLILSENSLSTPVQLKKVVADSIPLPQL